MNRLYRKQIAEEFLEAPFSSPNERFRFLNAPLSKETLLILSRRVDKLLAEVSELAEIDKVAQPEKSQPLGLVIAYRPWSFSVVKEYLKRKP